MNILLLSPYPERLTSIIEASGDHVTPSSDRPETLDGTAAYDWIISLGYRYLIGGSLLDQYDRRIINLHISLLPWNRGADPNFWSWFDDTPKGVSIHLIDRGIDTGDLIAQEEVRFGNGETMATSHARLLDAIVSLFADVWPRLRVGGITSARQPAGGSYHRSRDKEAFMARLPAGWHTPVAEVAALGAASRT
jgi:methionyl-tRNA formyltransferase